MFFICLGIFLGTAFCMKWLETGFYYNGELFTIIGLEITYSPGRIMDILHHIGEPVHTSIKAHLYFDFAFMAGAYGGILSLLMMARGRVSTPFQRQLLLFMALLQLLAWCCDIRENIYLLDWLADKQDIRTSIFTYHLVVLTKWSIALSGLLLAIPFLLRKTKPE